MRGVVQRAKYGKVTVDNEVVAEIKVGLVVLVGFSPADTNKEIDYVIDKVLNLRIFEDENGKMNLSLKDLGGEVLFIPNFTLYGDVRNGRRPSFINGAPIPKANELFEGLKKRASEVYLGKVQFGIFQADMKVELLNDGPITLLVDSEKIF